jgi:hypothetical protein
VAHLTEVGAVTIAITTANGASASTDIEGVSLDTANYSDVTCIVAMGPITGGAVTTIKLQGSADSAGSPDDWTDLEGTSQTVADDDDNQVFLVSCHRPAKRYIRVYVDRATQVATVGSAVYVQTNGRRRPATHGTNVNAAEEFASPAEGTA